jgi:hypothetical protein
LLHKKWYTLRNLAPDDTAANDDLRQIPGAVGQLPFAFGFTAVVHLALARSGYI